MVPQGFAFLVPAAEPAPRRLRIGYTSSDLKMQHPVAHLVAAMFSQHDLLSVEVYCFALSPSDGSAIRLQVEQAAQHFVDLTPALATSLVSAAEEINRLKQRFEDEKLALIGDVGRDGAGTPLGSLSRFLQGDVALAEVTRDERF